MYCTWKNTNCRKSKTILSTLKYKPNVFPVIECRISYWYHEQTLKCVAMHKYREQEKNWIKEIILPRGTKGNAGLVSRIYVNPFSYTLWQYWLSSIPREGYKNYIQKYIDFCPKINILKGVFCILPINVVQGCQTVQPHLRKRGA